LRLFLYLVICLLFSVQFAHSQIIGFEYDQIADPIDSATFSVDFAAMNAHRTINGFEVNFARLVDMTTGLDDFDLSDDLFGTAEAPDIPLLDMGPLETGILSVSIDALFFPALAAGRVGLNALFTDTVDSMFAIDFISLTIQTSTATIESFYGWPVGSENDGFGIGLSDGGDLPQVLPNALPFDSTGTGFDETISSMSIVPEPTTLYLLGLGAIALVKKNRSFLIDRRSTS